MVTRSGKRISHTDSPIRASTPAPGFVALLLRSRLSLGLWCASSAPKIRFPKALCASLQRACLCRGKSRLGKVTRSSKTWSRGRVPFNWGVRLRALLTFETFSWYQTTHALGGDRPSNRLLSPTTVLRPLGAAFANSLLRGVLTKKIPG